MSYFIARHLVRSVIVLFAVATLIFVMIHLAPGDPAQIYLGLNAGPDEIAGMRRRLGLDQSLIVQYGDYLGRLLRGDLGKSIFTERPVTALIGERAPITLELALVTVIFSSILAVSLGMLAAARRGKRADGVVRIGTVIGISLPNFWLGLMAILIFGLYVQDILPPGGWIRFTHDPLANLHHVILPAVVLGLPNLAIVTRTLRTSMLDELTRDYVTFARSMGLRERRVLRSLALPNAMIPTVTVIGLTLGYLISGAVIIETVFTIPGVGSMLVDAFRKHDYPLAIGATLFTAVFFVVANFAVDIMYAFFNPRIRDLYLRRAGVSRA